MAAVLNLTIAVDDAPAHLQYVLIDSPAPNPRTTLSNLAKRLTAYASGIKRSRYILRIDSSAADGTQDLLESANPTITITFAGAANGEDAVRIGGVVLAWATASANENQVTIGANLAAATTNMTAAINAHSKLDGIVSATGDTATGIITLTFLGDTRMASLLYLLAVDTNSIAVSASSFDGDTTDSHTAATALTDLGLA